LPSKTADHRQTVARIAAATRWGNKSPELVAAHRDLAADRLAEYVRKIVAAAPPLTPAQRDRIAILLRPVGGELVERRN
jgi:hypothetical protein